MGYVNMAWALCLSEPPRRSRGSASEGIGTQDRRRFTSRLCRYFIAFLRGDKAAMDREAAYRRQNSQAQGRFEHQEAATLACQGRLKEAAQRCRTGRVDLGPPGRLRWSRPLCFKALGPFGRRSSGLRAEARKNAAAALALYRSRDADYGLPLRWRFWTTHASSQDRGRPRTALPGRHLRPIQLSACAEGARSLNRGDPAKALEMTQAAAPYELGVPGTAYYSGAFFGALYPVYVRGLAFSRMGRHREAAAEFQKILDHPGLTLNDPIGPMARLQLARAWSASGDRANRPLSIRTSSLSGKMPIRIFRSCNKPSLSPQNCRERVTSELRFPYAVSR